MKIFRNLNTTISYIFEMYIQVFREFFSKISKIRKSNLVLAWGIFKMMIFLKIPTSSNRYMTSSKILLKKHHQTPPGAPM